MISASPQHSALFKSFISHISVPFDSFDIFYSFVIFVSSDSLPPPDPSDLSHLFGPSLSYDHFYSSSSFDASDSSHLFDSSTSSDLFYLFYISGAYDSPTADYQGFWIHAMSHEQLVVMHWNIPGCQGSQNSGS